MDISDAKAFIDLVNAEYKRRWDLLPEDDDGTGYNYDQWMFTDLPFLHDLCMLYMIARPLRSNSRSLCFIRWLPMWTYDSLLEATQTASPGYALQANTPDPRMCASGLGKAVRPGPPL
jgi:hypothetical protein